MDGLSATALPTPGAIQDTLAYASSGSPVDFDVTLFVMIALFLGMMWVLNRILFQPYLDTKDTRYQRIQGAKKEAQAMQDNAEEIFERYENQLADALQAGASQRNSIRAEGKEEEQKILGEARQEIDGMLGEARHDIQTQLEQARKDLNEQAEALSKTIVQKVLA